MNGIGTSRGLHRKSSLGSAWDNSIKIKFSSDSNNFISGIRIGIDKKHRVVFSSNKLDFNIVGKGGSFGSGLQCTHSYPDMFGFNGRFSLGPVVVKGKGTIDGQTIELRRVDIKHHVPCVVDNNIASGGREDFVLPINRVGPISDVLFFSVDHRRRGTPLSAENSFEMERRIVLSIKKDIKFFTFIQVSVLSEGVRSG